MNLSDLQFVVIVIAAGTGVGLGFAQKYGLLGFVIGFAIGAVGAFVAAFTVFMVIRFFAGKKKQSRIQRQDFAEKK